MAMIPRLKLQAAADSMHQFCAHARELFPGKVDDGVIEAVTVYLYTSLSRDLFGRRFGSRLQKRLLARLKYSTPAVVQGRLARIATHSAAIERLEMEAMGDCDYTPDDAVRAHVSSTLKAMLSVAGFTIDDTRTLTLAYERFERSIRTMRDHLRGIRKQNRFLVYTKRIYG